LAAVAVAATVSAGVGMHCSSTAVRSWRPGAGEVVRRGGLAARELPGAEQEDDLVIVLLSGLAASQRYWGASFDRLAEGATVVALDPAGFGSSFPIDTGRDLADPVTQVALLDEALAERGLTGRPSVVAGHSMGASLALRWAATAESVRGVVCFGAPLYRREEEVSERMRHLGWFESILARGPLAERVCDWMCRHRDAAQWLAVAVRPGLPVRIARDSVLHTWPGYIGAFTALITDPGWERALGSLAQRGVPVELVYGASDGVPEPGRAAELAAGSEFVSSRTVAGGHDLPLVSSAICVELIEAAAARARVNGA